MTKVIIYRRLLLLAAIPAMMLTSCSKEEISDNADSLTPVAFTAVVQPAALPQHTGTDGTSPATRTAIGSDGNTVWTQGDAVSITMLNSGGTLPDDVVPNCDNVRHNVNPATGELTPANGTPMHYPSHAAVNFIAWHASLTPDDNYILSLRTSDQTTVEKQLALDALYSDNAKGISRSNNPVALQFRHLMSKVRFDISLGWGLTNGTVTAVRLEGMIEGGSFDMRDGSVTKQLTPAEPIHTLRSTAAPVGADAIYTALLIPQNTNLTPRKIVITVNGKEYTGTIPSTDAYKANTMYTYPVTVGNTGVDVYPSTTDIPWTEGITTATATISGKTFRIIDTAEELARFATDVNAGNHNLNAIQNADIDLKDLAASTNPDYRALADNWVPIDAESFNGIYNGNGYTISGLHISSVTDIYAGFFGKLGRNALLTGICLRDANITISNHPKSLYTGVLVGKIETEGNVSICSATGKINVNCVGELYVGGLAGVNNGTITRSRTDVSVDGDVTLVGQACAYAGGITGVRDEYVNNTDGGLFACRATGNVILTGRHQGTSDYLYNTFYAGGIIGENKYYGAYAYSCLAEGNVSVTCETKGISVYAGGLVGENDSFTNLLYCYARGNVEVKGAKDSFAYFGAIVGLGTGYITHCYGTGAIGIGTSNFRANAKNNVVYNTTPVENEVYNTLWDNAKNPFNIPFTHYDPAATPAYGIDITTCNVLPYNFWLPGDGLWPVPDFARNAN